MDMPSNLMNKDELIRIATLSEAKVFKNSENIRQIIFSHEYSSPILEDIVSDMKTDLDILVKASRRLSLLGDSGE